MPVASKSNVIARKSAANKILNKMKEHSENLVCQVSCPLKYPKTKCPKKCLTKMCDFQAMMVSDELIRVVILWHEQWHEGLEEVSKRNVATERKLKIVRLSRPVGCFSASATWLGCSPRWSPCTP